MEMNLTTQGFCAITTKYDFSCEVMTATTSE